MKSKFTKFLEYVKDKHCTVIGMGVSNTPLIKLLVSAGAKVCVCDKSELSELDAVAVAEFSARGVEFVTGEKYIDDLRGDIIFRSPGIKPFEPGLVRARERGSIVTSEMEVFLAVCPAHTIGVTGSDGKTTTTSVIYEMLKAQGYTCYKGGNIGTPLLEFAGDMKKDEYAVLELSSFQLMTFDKSPEISVITNITPNHLDWHKDMDEYINAKRNVYLSDSNRRVVLNADNSVTHALREDVNARAVMFSRKSEVKNGVYAKDGVIYAFGEKMLDCADIKIPGVHNIENYMAAIGAVYGIVSKENILKVAREFSGVEHRMELVRTVRGVKYYNDSIASSPTRTIAGLRALDTKVILIAGGYDKKIPFDVLGPEAVKYVKRLILVGQTSNLIREAVVKAPGYSREELPIVEYKCMEDAVSDAYSNAKTGDIVTLSPACASFDLYKNFALRGRHFKAIVNNLEE